MIRLIFERKGAPGIPPEMRVFDKPVVWVGREVKASDPTREAVWLLQYPDVSRTQCKFEDTGDAVCVEPLSTRSATFVNGQRIDGVTRLVPGDSIRFGDCRLRFVAEVAATAQGDERRDRVEKKGEIRDLAPQQQAAQIEKPVASVLGAAVALAAGVREPATAKEPPQDSTADVSEDMSPIVARAQRWDELGRPAGELLRDPALLERGQGWLRGGAGLGGAAALVRTYVEASVQARRAGWQQRGLIGAWLAGAVVTGSITAHVLADELVFRPLPPPEGAVVVCKQEVVASADSVAQAAEKMVDDRGALLISALAVEIADEGGCLAQSQAERQLRRLLAGQRSQHLGAMDNSVVKIAVMSNGQRAATIDAKGTVRVWNLETRDARDLEVKGSVVKWSRDAAWLIVGGPKGEVTLFAAGAWPPERKLQSTGHRGEITLLEISPASDLFVTGDARGELKLWSLRGDSLERPPASASAGAPIEAAAFDAKSRRLFTLAGKKVRIWPLDGERLGQPRALAAEGVRVMAVNAAGDEILTGDKDGIVNLWDVKQGRPRLAHDPFDAPIAALAFVPEKAALVATENKVLVHLDLSKPQRGNERFAAVRLDDMSEPTQRLVVEGQRAVTVGANGQPEVWDLVEITKRPKTRLDGHSQVTAMAAADQQSVLITGDANGSVRSWAILGDNIGGAHVLDTRGREIRDIALDPKGVLLASVDSSGAVHVWKTEGEGAPIDLGELRKVGPVSRVAISADASWIAGVGDGMIVVWNVDMKQHEPLTGAHPLAQWIGWSTAGDVLVSAGRDQVVREWQVEPDALRPTAVMRNVGGEIERMAVSDRRTAVSVRRDNVERTLYIWPLREEGTALPAPLVSESAATRALLFDVKGTRLAAGFANGMTRTWSFEGDEPRATRGYDTSAVMGLSFAVSGELAIGEEKGQVLVLHPDEKDGLVQPRATYRTPVVSLAFGASADVLVSAAREARIVLHRGSDPGSELDLVGHRKNVSSLLAHPNGNFVVSAAEDEALRVWPLQAKGLVQLACRTAGRDLRAEEWRMLPRLKPRELCANLPGE